MVEHHSRGIQAGPTWMMLFVRDFVFPGYFWKPELARLVLKKESSKLAPC
jgi:hypothetical protein